MNAAAPGARGVTRRILNVAAAARRRLRRLVDAAAYRWFSIVHRHERLVEVSIPQRIGHLCTEMDALLKERILDGVTRPGLVFAVPRSQVANPHLLGYLGRHMRVVDRDPAALRHAKRRGDPAGIVLSTHPYAVAMYQTARAYEVFSRWGPRPPLFRLDDDDRACLRETLALIGLPEGAWYCCLHVREGDRRKADEHMHRFRDVPLSTYLAAIDEIHRRGGWVVRMGDRTMTPAPTRPGLVDYATGGLATPRRDVVLVAGCRLFLGSASGLYSLAEMFGRPCALANLAPLSAAWPFAPGGVGIPQVHLDRSGRELDLARVMESPIAAYRLPEQFAAAGVRLVPNSSEDTLACLREVLDRLDGSFVETDEDRARQESFRALLEPGHYGFGAGSRIGRDFLRARFQG